MNLRIRPEWWDGNIRILALLVVLTILPAACVLWFMNAAVANDAVAAQERILAAYRGQLHLVRSRLDALWRAQAERLNASGDPSRDLRKKVTTLASTSRASTHSKPLLEKSSSCSAGSLRWTRLRSPIQRCTPACSG